ncbi:thioredoxin [Gulosibacter molinativorax]|uniref:Thioredoxin n=1 Tax=Gulosibacter molinativorax TaxID=256821 RepID=A0ABT7C916_9MICO|nr:thioredoxin [Gulosibacter molinativorax]MDJ1371709.1 thioredoxin [Gulosibacter molinativorax]QUY63130.1 Thioredoxin [Gulosibacter molinativorax]
MANVTNATGATFDEQVLGADGAVIVDFWAPWCGPCRQVSPVLDQIADEHPGVKVVKVNVDEEMDLAMQYQVTSIPAIKLFRDGEVRKEVVGAKPKGALLKDFEGLLD